LYDHLPHPDPAGDLEELDVAVEAALVVMVVLVLRLVGLELGVDHLVLEKMRRRRVRLRRRMRGRAWRRGLRVYKGLREGYAGATGEK
jgi:hypothetical protein